MDASAMGCMILLGKMPIRVWIKLGVSAAVYSRELVDSTGNPFLNRFAIKSPMVTAKKVVHI